MATRDGKADWHGDLVSGSGRAEEAKAGCIISRALGGVGEITLAARLR